MKKNDMGWDISKGPRNFIQWKGTDVCMDFHCTCGNTFHLDEDFTYAVKCLKCECIWRLGTEVSATLITSEHGHADNAATGDQELSIVKESE